METFEPGNIIQITDPSDKWYSCLIIISEVKSWGIQGYITIPRNDGEPLGQAYYRLKWGQFERVGNVEIFIK